MSSDYFDGTIDNWGIADERGYYYSYTGLLNSWGRNWHQHRVSIMAAQIPPNSNAASCAIGMFGYTVDSSVHVIDPLALADNFLAQLPAKRPFRIGHFERAFPEGYIKSVQSNENQIKDSALRFLYNDTQAISKDDLFDANRWFAIWRINTGYHKKSVLSSSYNPDLTGAGLVTNPVRNTSSCMGMSQGLRLMVFIKP